MHASILNIDIFEMNQSAIDACGVLRLIDMDYIN